MHEMSISNPLFGYNSNWPFLFHFGFWKFHSSEKISMGIFRISFWELRKMHHFELATIGMNVHNLTLTVERFFLYRRLQFDAWRSLTFSIEFRCVADCLSIENGFNCSNNSNASQSIRWSIV